MNLSFKNVLCVCCLLMVFTQVKENAQIEKYYGLKTSEDCVMEVKA